LTALANAWRWRAHHRQRRAFGGFFPDARSRFRCGRVCRSSDLARHISALIINQSTDNTRPQEMSHARKEYRDFMSLTPDAYDAVLALGQIAGKAGMDKQLLELIKLRASQINGCAFCVQYHILEGEKLGV